MPAQTDAPIARAERKPRIVSPAAFADKALSLTLIPEFSDEAKLEEWVQRYWLKKATPQNKHLPGLCWLDDDQLGKHGFKAEPDKDEDDPEYGDLHHLLVPDADDAKAIDLALIATQQVLREFFKCKQRTDPEKPSPCP